MLTAQEAESSASASASSSAAHDGVVKLSQRPSKSCTECIRRKTRCNKQIPCDLCLKRGVAHLCRLDAQYAQTAFPAPLPSLTGNDTTAQLNQLRESLYAEINSLRGRVARLERQAGDGREASGTRENSAVGEDAEEDAATTLEFFALGMDRRAGADRAPKRVPTAGAQAHIVPPDSDRTCDYPPDITEALLPRPIVQSILAYAERRTSWQHCCVFFPTFFEQVEAFWTAIDDSWSTVEPTWVALLYVLQGIAVHQMSDEEAVGCGLQEADRYVLPNALIQAAEDALHLGHFLSRPTIWTCQATAILAVCGHNVCDSDLLSSLLAIGIKTAQTLNLHSLGGAARNLDKSPAAGHAGIVDVELGKRVWWALTMEDWFGIPFRGVCAVHPDHFNTPLPNNCHDADLSSERWINRPDTVLTVSFKQRFSSKMAQIVHSVFDSLRNCPPQSTFAVAEEHASKLRALLDSLPPALNEMPANGDVSHVAAQPVWARAARHYILISGTHKLLVIYRAFLARTGSTHDRVKAHAACVDAAEAIVAELERGGQDPHVVQALWTIPYHSLAAAVVLAMDMINLAGRPEAARRREWVVRAQAALERLAPTSRIARRGLQILSDLFRAAESMSRSKRRTSDSVALVVKKIKLPSDETYEPSSVSPSTSTPFLPHLPIPTLPGLPEAGDTPFDWSIIPNSASALDDSDQLLAMLQASVPNVAALFDGSLGNFS